MKKNEPSQSAFLVLAKSVRVLFQSLFFLDSDRDFQRLKSFIAS